MQISVLIPAYARPEQLAEAFASIAAQDRTLIGEIVVGDDSPPAYWKRNEAVVMTSELADLIDYVRSDPPKGTYPNQWFLASRAKYAHILFLHNDDTLCAGALRSLADACSQESDTRVKVWFGRNHIADDHGNIDAERTGANDRKYGKDGESAARPMWQWALTESLPPNSFLIEKTTYLQHMAAPRDGNVGDWGLVVRLANAGAWGRFIAEYMSTYRVQTGSVTNAGSGMDVHRFYELASQLQVPDDARAPKRRRVSELAVVATIRYARDGERLRAWKCFLSSDWTIRQRLSKRGLATALILSTPRFMWNWALRFK